MSELNFGGTGEYPARWLTVDEAAVILRVTRKAVYAAIREGHIRSRKVGKWVRIASSEILPPTVKATAGAPQP